MKVDLRTPPSHPVAEVVAFAQRCEEAGFHACGFNDSQLYFRDAFVVASHVLANTERLVVHPALTCPGPRHASVIASAAKTVQEFGPGRYELWLGRGDAAVSTTGQRAVTLSATRQAVGEIMRTMAGEWGVWGDSHVHLHHSDGPPIPVFLGGRAPKVIGIAGELCDGVMLGVPPNAESIAEARGWLADGAAKAGRDPGAIETVLPGLHFRHRYVGGTLVLGKDPGGRTKGSPHQHGHRARAHLLEPGGPRTIAQVRRHLGNEPISPRETPRPRFQPG